MMLRFKTLRTILIVVGIVVVTSYSAFEAHGLIAGPSLTVTSPLSGSVVTDPLVHIQGNAVRTVKTSINGRALSTSETGEFNEPLALSSGYNVIMLSAEDRFGKTTEQELVLIYKPSQEIPLAPLSPATSTGATTTPEKTDSGN